MIGELPGAVVAELLESGGLEVINVGASAIPQLVFRPSSFALFNDNVSWLKVLKARR
jgi:hypothetical protein